ncbi:MAG: DUF4300 family protein [Romboutsia sp.]
MKVKGYIASIICLTMLFTGCSNKDNENNTTNNNGTQINTENEKPNYSKGYKLIYSNLISKDTQKEVSDKLEKSGVKKEYIYEFIEKVNLYNEKMKEMKGLEGKFVNVDSPKAPYDEAYAGEKWESFKKIYQDFNCRITAFELFRDYVESGSKFTENPPNLMVDLDTIEKNPLSKLNKSEIAKFTNIYAAVPAKDTKNTEEHVDSIKKELENRKITFKENNKMSMINIYLHDYDFKELFVGHAGILIEEGDELLFVEKYAPTMPYQVSKFKNRKEVYSYLMDRLDVDTTGNASKPIIMENGEEMKY